MVYEKHGCRYPASRKPDGGYYPDFLRSGIIATPKASPLVELCRRKWRARVHHSPFPTQRGESCRCAPTSPTRAPPPRGHEVPLLSVAHSPLPVLVQRASMGNCVRDDQWRGPMATLHRPPHTPNQRTTSGSRGTLRRQPGREIRRAIFSHPFWERSVSPRARDPPRALRAPRSARPTRRRTSPPPRHQVASGRAQHYPTRAVRVEK